MYRITTLSQHHKNKHVLSANTSTKAWIRFNEVRKIRYAMLPVSFELANMFMFEKLFFAEAAKINYVDEIILDRR